MYVDYSLQLLLCGSAAILCNFQPFLEVQQGGCHNLIVLSQGLLGMVEGFLQLLHLHSQLTVEIAFAIYHRFEFGAWVAQPPKLQLHVVL